jgi:hypothetical protein
VNVALLFCLRGLPTSHLPSVAITGEVKDVIFKALEGQFGFALSPR